MIFERTMASFYIVAASDSSKTFFPSNTLAHFSTQLVQPLCDTGVWEVALCEIFTPPTGDFKSDLDASTPIYLYCDVIKPQLVSDTSARLLRVLPPPPPSGSHEVTSRYYLPIDKRGFSTLTLSFATKQGTRYPFPRGEHPSIVVLHFREVKSA